MNRIRTAIYADKTFKSGYSGKNIGIALLDSGIARHSDISERITVFRDFVYHKEDPYDDNGHGTHVAGILSGNGTASEGKLCGIAPQANLIALKVLDAEGNGETEDVLKALAWVDDHQKIYNIRLLNFSVGFLPSANYLEQQKLIASLEELWDKGVMVVTAAGNRGPRERTVTVPGISRKILTVGASDDDLPASSHMKRGYSGNGPTGCCIVKPEILAPGTRVLSCSNLDNGYVHKSGTSMAAPVVCGALALAFERFPSMTPAQMKLRLHETVQPKGVEIHRNCWGILNVDNLMGLN